MRSQYLRRSMNQQHNMNYNNTPVRESGNESNSTLHQTIYHKKEVLKSKKTFYLRLALLLAAINLVLIVNSFGQAVTVNNVCITNTAQITIKGDLMNNSGAFFNNTGTIDLTGNITNNSGNNLFGISAGNVVLNGGAQNIMGTDVTHFNDLSISGTGTKTLQQDILVGGNNSTPSGVLSLDQVLDLNANEITINNALPSAITRTTGFIASETNPAQGYGMINWKAGENVGNYEFPFGNALTNSYIPVNIQITTPGVGVNGTLSLGTYPTTTTGAPNNRPLPTGLSSLVDYTGIENATKVVDRWWVMGASTYSTNPMSNISFTYRDSEWDATGGSTNNINESSLKSQSHNGSVWTPVPMGVVNPALNTVVIYNVNIYNPVWTLVSGDSPLPIELLTFDALLNKDDQVELSWATATEINNDFFTIEKSNDGVNFEIQGYVDGAGNSNNLLFYESLDKLPFEGVSYYRLKQTDFDGQFSYSDIKIIRREKAALNTFTVFPNPAINHFYVKFDEEVEAQSLFIIDMNGKVVREIAIATVETVGAGLIKIDRLSMEAGMYFVSTSEGKMQKLVLQ